MSILDDLDYNKPILFDSWKNKDNIKEKLYFSKTYFKELNCDHYFFKYFTTEKSGNIKCIAYIYFYLDEIKKESNFIGIYVNPSHRGRGLSSILISYWIQFCLENGFEFLTTSKTQRKPFLLYLLKQFSFELKNKDLYETSSNVITICSGVNPKVKYLLFRDKEYQQSFVCGRIYKGDSYEIVHELSPNIKILDHVLLSTTYFLQDQQDAYRRASNKCKQKSLL